MFYFWKRFKQWFIGRREDLQRYKYTVHIIERLPVDQVNLDLKRHPLGFYSKNQLINIMSSIPGRVRDLSLEDSGMWVYGKQNSSKELAKVLSLIPSGVTKLNLAFNFLFDNKFDNEALDGLHIILKAIPRTIQVLSLRQNRLHRVSDWNSQLRRYISWSENEGASLAKAFSGISPQVKELDLAKNLLGELRDDELAQAWAGLSASGITTLDLSENHFGDFPQAFKQVLSKLPKSIKCLNLSGNTLGLKDAKELADALKALSPGVTALDLTNNYLGNKSINDLVAILSAIPITVKSLRLGHELLYNKKSSDLRSIFASLPQKLDFLDMDFKIVGRYNNSPTLHTLSETLSSMPPVKRFRFKNVALYSKTAQEVAVFFSSLPSSILELDLSGSPFIRSVPQAGDALAGIPDGVRKLNLSGQDLAGLRWGRTICQVLAGIPPHVTSLDLSNNYLSGLSTTAFQTILSGISPHVLELKLSQNDLSAPNFQLAQALPSLSAGVTTLDLSDTGLGQLAQVEWMRVISAIPKHVTSINLEDNQLLVGKTRNEVDEILSNLPGGKKPRPPGEKARYRLANNGEPDYADFARALTPLLSVVRQGDVKNGALPRDVVANILAFTVSSSPTEQTRKQVTTIVDKIVPDEFQLLSAIQLAVFLAVSKSHEWYRGKAAHRGPNGFFTWFRHGQAEQKSADNLLALVQRAETSAQAITILEAFFNDSNTTYYRHSPASFLRDELKTVYKTPWAGLEPDPLTNSYPSRGSRPLPS